MALVPRWPQDKKAVKGKGFASSKDLAKSQAAFACFLKKAPPTTPAAGGGGASSSHDSSVIMDDAGVDSQRCVRGLCCIQRRLKCMSTQSLSACQPAVFPAVRLCLLCRTVIIHAAALYWRASALNSHSLLPSHGRQLLASDAAAFTAAA